MNWLPWRVTPPVRCSCPRALVIGDSPVTAAYKKDRSNYLPVLREEARKSRSQIIEIAKRRTFDRAR